MRGTRMMLAALVIAGLAVGSASARPIDGTAKVAADGTVSISNVAGSVRVVGIDTKQVRVTGKVDDNVEEVRIEEAGGNVEIEVVLERRIRGRGGEADLVVEVPRGARLEVETVSASIEVQDMEGRLELESVSGSITASGAGGHAEISTVSGEIDVEGARGRIQAESVSGEIRLRKAQGEIELETTSGAIDVEAGDIDRLECSTVSGAIRFQGKPRKEADIALENFSGSVVLILPADLDADVDVETFSGDIDDEFDGRVRRPKFGPGASLSTTYGSGSAQISVSTFSGSVELRKGGR